MSLDTLLEIGKILRKSPEGLKHHRYVKSAPQSSEKVNVKFINIPVTKDFEILFNEQSELESDFIKEKLYYLNFKKGDADSTKKYIFGDICQNITKTGEESNFKLGDPSVKAKGFQINSFYRAKEEAKFFEDKECGVSAFRNSLEKNINYLTTLLNDEPNIFIHFDFNGKHWYELENEWKQINDLQMSYFASFNKEIDKYILGAYLHRSLRPNDQKAKVFESLDEISDLMYAVDYSKRSKITEREIKIIVLPSIKEREIKAEDLEKFFDKQYTFVDDTDIILDQEQLSPIKHSLKEPKKKNKIQEDKLIELAENLEKNTNFDIYDFLFTKAGGLSSPDFDLIEISGIQKSFLVEITKRIISIKEKLHNEFIQELPKLESSPNLQVFWAFNNILGDITKDKKKYRNHLLKVLPKIYTASYIRDDLLLPCFIQQVETKIRDGTENYNFLKYEYYFLVYLRNPINEPLKINNGEINRMKQDSISYQIGLKLGELAKPLGAGKNPKINSFQKNYVGLLSRRISELKDVIKFTDFINEKLCIHNVSYPSLQKSFLEITERIKELKLLEYNKHECAFGFFESYFKHENKENAANTTDQISEGE